MKLKSFSATSEWYFVFEEPPGKTITYRLAGFAVVEGAPVNLHKFTADAAAISCNG